MCVILGQINQNELDRLRSKGYHVDVCDKKKVKETFGQIVPDGQVFVFVYIPESIPELLEEKDEFECKSKPGSGRTNDSEVSRGNVEAHSHDGGPTFLKLVR